MAELSPAAQSVINAAVEAGGGYGRATPVLHARIAAALRAAADQCKIEWNYHPDYPETESVVVVSKFRAIADELEAL